MQVLRNLGEKANETSSYFLSEEKDGKQKFIGKNWRNPLLPLSKLTVCLVLLSLSGIE